MKRRSKVEWLCANPAAKGPWNQVESKLVMPVSRVSRTLTDQWAITRPATSSAAQRAGAQGGGAGGGRRGGRGRAGRLRSRPDTDPKHDPDDRRRRYEGQLAKGAHRSQQLRDEQHD